MTARARARTVAVLITCPTTRIAKRIGAALVARRLAACVNIVPGVESLFWWKGKVDRAKEVLLIAKTTAAMFERLRRCVVSMHPYDVPEVIAIQLSAGHAAYLAWISASVQAR